MSWVGFENVGGMFAPIADAQLKNAYADYKAQQDLSAMMRQQTADRIALQEARMKTGLEDPRTNNVQLDPYTARGMVSDFGIPINPRQPIQQIPVKNPNLPDTNLIQEADKAAKDAGLTSSLEDVRRDISSEPYVDNLPRELDPYVEALRQQHPDLIDERGRMDPFTYNNLRQMAEAKAKIEANALAKAGELRSTSFVKAYGESQANIREDKGNQSAKDIKRIDVKSAEEIARERNKTAKEIAEINARRPRGGSRGFDPNRKTPTQERILKSIGALQKEQSDIMTSKRRKAELEKKIQELNREFDEAGQVPVRSTKKTTTPPPVKKTYEEFLKGAGIPDSPKAKEIYKKKHSSIGSGQNRSVAGDYDPGQRPVPQEDSLFGMRAGAVAAPGSFWGERAPVPQGGYNYRGFAPGERPVPVEEPGYDRNKLTTDQAQWRFDPITGKPIRR